MLDGPLRGHVAIVTGANHGIGAATARELAARGAAVLVTYLRVAGTGDGEADDAEEPGARAVAALALPRAVARGPERGQQQIRKRLDHRTSSISCRPLPPVRRRKTSVS